ncbi:MAG: hydroxylamine oxidoreductase [Planctomycetes bacterium]|nr:hydroxylamine oxidoreductase [Planctomycetota bacterium]
MEVARKRQEAGLAEAHIAVPETSKGCVECHEESSPGIVAHWRGSTHARKGVACLECHVAAKEDADAFSHYGQTIATIVTPRDCARCHVVESKEFAASHHSKAANILASLDNLLAETIEGSREPFNPHSKNPGRADAEKVNGMASVESGCRQCHGSKVAVMLVDGKTATMSELKPGPDGRPTAGEVVDRIARDPKGKPVLTPGSWPNTGIGRINLDGSLGSCSACHSRHDFSPRRARQPENCGKCHLGPDHPQEEIYNESKHGVAFRDLREKMNLDSPDWVLGKDYSAAPTCATCHMSGHTRNGGKVTHDPGERISWTNRPSVSLVMDTDADHGVVKETDPEKRRGLVADTWQQKRQRMTDVCTHCHSIDYVNSFYRQYDDLVRLYNEKFGKPGGAIMSALKKNGLLSEKDFDENIEWDWYLIWHHEGRRARMGASMMAPDYTHWHGMYEVAERWYTKFIPEAREIVARAKKKEATKEKAEAAEKVLEEIMSRPEHAWPDQFRKPK